MLGIWVLIFATPYGEALGIIPDDDGLFSQDLANDCVGLPQDIKVKLVLRCDAPLKLFDLFSVYRF